MTRKVVDLLDRIKGPDCKNSLIHLVAEDKSHSEGLELKETMQMMTKKQCEEFWNTIYQAIQQVDTNDDQTDQRANLDVETHYNEKDLKFFEAIQSIILLMLSSDIVWCESAYNVLRYLHRNFFLLPEEMQESVSRIFEEMWIKEHDFRECFVPNMCQYLMHQASQRTKHFNGYMKRINAIRDSFKLIDFSSTQSNDLKYLIIESFSIPQFVTNPNGKRILSLFFTLTPSFPVACFHSLQTCLLSLSNSLVRTWGDIIIASDLACEDEETRDILEKDVIQEIMRIAIHAANQHVFIVTKTILATFIHCRNHKELWTRLTELYEPLLFRSLSATNSIVRRHAVIIFTDCFPLGTSDTRDSYSIEEQFKALLILCDDECPSVRSVAIAGILHLIRNYYELLPVSVTTVILDHFTQHLVFDQRSEVREFCFKGIIELLENRLVYSVLFPRIMKLWCFIFDKNLRIRRLFLQLLIRLQNIKSFDMTSFLSIQDFLTMFLYDYSTNPANSITKLYLKFLFPLFWKEKNEYKFVTRVHNFLLLNNEACYVFFKESIRISDLNESIKLILLLLKSYFLCIETEAPVEKSEKSEKVDKAEKSSTTKSKRGKKRKASEISTNPEDQSNDSLENKQIPISDPVFQQKLFHLIVLMMKAFQVRCTDEELSNTYEYMKEILTTERLKNLHQHMTTSESEDDFLSFLSFFNYSVIDSIQPNFVSIILSSSQSYLMNHLPLFMQLVYQWNVGKQIVESALNQIHSALQNPEATFDTEEEQAITVIMPLKKQKLSKGKKKQTVTTPEIVLSLTQSVSLLKAIVNDSLSKTTSYSPTIIETIHSTLIDVLPSFQAYMFPPNKSYYEQKPQLATYFYYELIALLFKEELIQAANGFVQDITDKHEEEDTTSELTEELPSFLGKIPPSMIQFLEILKNTQFTMDIMGNYYLSLFTLLLSCTSKATSLFIWNDQFAQDLVMTLRKLLAILFSYDSSDETPISHEEQEMKTFAIQQILPVFGKWLSFIHSLYSSFSQSNTNYPSSLLYEILNTFPRECIAYIETEIIMLIKAYPSQLETYLEVLLHQLLQPCVISTDYPSLNDLQLLISRRKQPEFSFILSRLSRNYNIMRYITDFLYEHLKIDQLVETFGVFCLLMTCFEARLEQKMKIPATLLSPLVKFIDHYNEKYRETLTAREDSPSKQSMEYIGKIAAEIVSYSKQVEAKKGKKKQAQLAVIDEESEYLDDDSSVKEKKEERDERMSEINLNEEKRMSEIDLNEEKRMSEIDLNEEKRVSEIELNEEKRMSEIDDKRMSNLTETKRNSLTNLNESKRNNQIELHEESTNKTITTPIELDLSDDNSIPLEEESLDMDIENEPSVNKENQEPVIPTVAESSVHSVKDVTNHTLSDSYFDEPEY